QDPRAGLRPSAVDGLCHARPHAGRFGGDPGIHGHRLRGDRPVSGIAPDLGQPESFTLTPENRARDDRIIARYPAGRQASAVLALLDLAQRQNGGWLSRAAMDHVAEILDMAPIRVYEIGTFYSMLNLQPVGRHHIQVCRTTPCWLSGSDELT